MPRADSRSGVHFAPAVTAGWEDLTFGRRCAAGTIGSTSSRLAGALRQAQRLGPITDQPRTTKSAVPKSLTRHGSRRRPGSLPKVCGTPQRCRLPGIRPNNRRSHRMHPRRLHRRVGRAPSRISSRTRGDGRCQSASRFQVRCALCTGIGEDLTFACRYTAAIIGSTSSPQARKAGGGPCPTHFCST
jgi:hypothetical protein